jgi:hypothetical protein
MTRTQIEPGSPQIEGGSVRRPSQPARARSRPSRRAALCVVVTAAGLATAAAQPAAPATPALHFIVAATTELKLTDVVWSGTRFFYVDNTTNRVFTAGSDGVTTGLFATMPNIVEETRCVPSPPKYGFPKAGLFCHSPDNRIYRIAPDGTTTVFATLPETEISDGALTFDRVGSFGHRLVAATGRSGGDGGKVFTIDAAGVVRLIGAYPGPGGAENVVIAPATFGSQAGSALLALDKDDTAGSLVALSAKGTATTIASFPDGANSLAVVPSRLRTTGVPAAGFYVVDTAPGTVQLATADQFEGHAGEVIVGTEVKGTIWLVAPKGAGFTAVRLPTNLSAPLYNFEGAAFVP